MDADQKNQESKILSLKRLKLKKTVKDETVKHLLLWQNLRKQLFA